MQFLRSSLRSSIEITIHLCARAAAAAATAWTVCRLPPPLLRHQATLPPPAPATPISQKDYIWPLKTSGVTCSIMPKRKHAAEGTTPSKKQQRPSSGAAAAHPPHQRSSSSGASSASSSQQSPAAAFMQRMDSFSTSAIVRDASGSVRMVSRDKGLNVVAQLTGMGINEQLCALHLLSQPLVCSPHAVHRAQQALLKGCNTVEEAMEWIDEEEQRRKHAAPIATSSSAAALSPQAVGPLVLDDFMSQWLHPNWSRVSCVAKMHLSPEQRKSRGESAIQMSLSQSIVVPQGHQLFLLFVDGGPQPPRPVTAWKLATPGEVVAEAGELCAHIDAMTRQGVLQRVVSAGGCMHSIDLRLLTVTNLSRGISSRLVPERSVASVPSRPYQEWPVTENSMLFNVFDAHGNDFHFAPTAPPYVIVKSRLFQRKPVLQLPCSSIQTISFTPLQDMLPFSDLLLCSGLPLKLEDLLAEVRKHVRSCARSVPAQDLDDCCIGKDVVPLTDCMTGARMTLPGRSIYCRHASAFDLPGFLDAALKTGLWRCPICLPCSLEVPQRPLLLHELHVDALMQDIVASCKPTNADHCSIEVVRAAGGSRDICLSHEGDAAGTGLCSVHVQAFEKRSPQTILLSLQLQATIANAV